MTEETATTFPVPTIEEVDHALRELGWEDRLTVHKMTASAGNSATHIYSLPSAVVFLFGTKWDAPLLEPGFKGGLNWVDLNRFATWLRESVGEEVLAEAVEQRVLPLSPYKAQIAELQIIMTERMDQYRAVRAEAAAAEAGQDGGEADASE